MFAKEEEIFLVQYDTTWPKKFEKEKKLLKKTIGEFVVGGIHHVGSTSIPGISAKPIIDIMIGVESLKASKPAIKLLKRINYMYYPYKPDQMHWFVKPNPLKRTHHLHLIPTNSSLFKERLAFRNYLRENSEARYEYQRLKTELAEKFRYDREAYTNEKTEFVNKILKKTTHTS